MDYLLLPLTCTGLGVLTVSLAFLFFAYLPGLEASRNSKNFPPAASFESSDKSQSIFDHLRPILFNDIRNGALEIYRSSGNRLPWGDHILFWSGASGVCLIGVLSLLSLSGALWIRLLSSNHKQDTAPVDCAGSSGNPHETKFTLKAARWMPWLHIEGAWAEFSNVMAVFDGYGEEAVVVTHRGHSETLTRVLRVQDCLGLTAVTFQLPTVVSSVTILPHKIKYVSDSDLPLATQTGDEPMLGGVADGDRVDIRQYQLGDSARHILWRLVARTGGQKIYVRTPEPVAQSVRAIFLVAGAGDYGNAELARYLVEEFLSPGSWIFGTSRSDVPTQDRHEALRLIAASGNWLTSTDPVVEPHVAFSHFEQFCSRRQCRKVILLVPHDEDAVKALGKISLISQRVYAFGTNGKMPSDWDGMNNVSSAGISFVELRHV